MKRIKILSPGFGTPNGSAFLFPLILFNKYLRNCDIDVTIYSRFNSDLFDADVIGVDSKFHKHMWSIAEHKIFEQFDILKNQCKLLIYFDTTDSTGNLQTEIFDYVDIYCKGQVLKDRNKYQKPFYGNRIYSDYVHKKFNLNDNSPEVSKPLLSKKKIKKLKISWNSGLADYSSYGPLLMKLYNYIPIKRLLSFKKEKKNYKDIEIHARFGSEYSRNTVAWQRKEISLLLKDIPKKKISRFKYFSELKKTKIVISPFGWGEITLKDFESFMCNVLLFKPSMEHLATWPNFFVDNKTYIPFSWDLSDFIHKLEMIKKNYSDLEEIANFGRENYYNYASAKGAENFTRHFQEIINQ